MAERDVHCEKELAAFIRTGALRRPEQAYGDYFKGRNASCALGAAYDGMYRLPSEIGKANPTKDLDWFFDCLERTIRQCPVEGCKKKLGLAVVIVHLNDDHCWSREQIAAWVAGEPVPAEETH
jgi:hypothetical protein